MLNRFVIVLFSLGIIFNCSLSLTQPAWAETFVDSSVHDRLILALSVGQSDLQKWLPTPWQVNPSPKGPLKGANLYLLFIDSLLVEYPQGKPDRAGSNRYMVLAIPAKNIETGEVAVVVIRGFSAKDLPGPYKNYVLANVLRKKTHKGANQEAEMVDDSWEIQDARGGKIELTVQYQRGILSRTKSEQKTYSAVEPKFFRIYRTDSAADIVKSMPTDVNRLLKYKLSITMPELSKLFDGTEQLVGVIVIPLYLRQIFLP